MKHIVCYCLVLCLTIIGLPACAPQEATADVYAIQLGDTKKQVIEKAGEPDFKKGLGYDVFGYITNEFETEAKLFWLRNEKVVMMATADITADNEFSDWEIDESYTFQPLKRPREISVWEPGLDIYDIIGYFGPEFSYSHNMYPTCFITYELENGARLENRFSGDLIREAIYIEQDGTQTVLWVLEQEGAYLF